jgi:probable LLM family oxidoreductase
MEIGIYSFGDIAIDRQDKSTAAGAKRMQELLEEIKLADELGLDVFALGEHHRKDYMVSAPAVVLGAAASITKNIRLSSAVTVLSSDDPVRVFQQYATVDLISNGRAEIMAGRGSFIESFPLFGYDLDDYDTLFSEKLDLLLRINEDEIVRWSGQHRAPLPGLGVYPRPVQEKLPIWIAVGGTPASVVRAGKLGLPLAIAIIGGIPARFNSLTELYRKAYSESNQPADQFQLGINAHVFVGDNSQDAADAFFPSYAAMMTQIGRERGWPPVTRAQFESMRSPKASLMVGSVSEVTEKMLYWHELFGHTRFLAQMTVGPTPHRELMRSIELFGSKVAPEVRKHIQSSAIKA